MTQFSKTEIAQFMSDTLLSGANVTHDENLLLTGRLDSLGVMTLVAYLEKQTGQPIPASDVTLENFASIDAMSDYLARAA